MVNKNNLSFYSFLAFLICLSIFVALKFFSTFVNSNFFIAIVTLGVGSVAIALYLVQKVNKRRDAAKIILQEIRRAEDIISDYKEHRQYKFTKKIIATNSWAKNIHHFVGDLQGDELDKISDLYSTGAYLDSIITKISDFNFKQNTDGFMEQIKNVTTNFRNDQGNDPNLSGGNIKQGIQVIPGGVVPPSMISIQAEAPWKSLLDEITDKQDPIYYSTICDKIKKIAKLK